MSPSVKPMLGDLELPFVQEIITHERRVLAEQKLPGFEGSTFQNMGRRATRISLVGVACGEAAEENLTKLREEFQSGQPLSFVADITTGTELTQVRVADLQVEEVAGKPERFVYCVDLEAVREVQEPEPAPGASINQDARDEARGLMDNIVKGLDVGLKLASGLERRSSRLRRGLTRVRQFRAGIGRILGR